MDSAFTHLSRWFSGKHNEPKIFKTASSSSSSSSNVQSDSMDKTASSLSSSSSFTPVRTKRRRRKDEGEIDKEFDVVLVQSDCAESEDLDWSIGWLEPHGPELQGEDDSENSFAVLVPSYGHRHINLEGGNQQSSKEEKQVEKWISYFQKS